MVAFRCKKTFAEVSRCNDFLWFYEALGNGERTEEMGDGRGG